MLPCSRSRPYAPGGRGPRGAIPTGSGYEGYGILSIGGPNFLGGGRRVPKSHLEAMTINPIATKIPIVQEMMQIVDIPEGASFDW